MLERQKQRLPVFKHRNAILYLVENHATTIVVGETGSGKTTQIPQVCLKTSFFMQKLEVVKFWTCFCLQFDFA